eukprot:gnl/MRDRNA2_/MRDRNA2_145210_c0_seq1.p2 gnl/MRDRNA2_/MRDRNA2_145210_c0~~gnl/MRDRNA2_/MRDRNA2_145210_c0_seq1.p2  ORF type:complete len:134 (+),score=23.70 gnl/MRDRNA2_/MRDRNA2_145210_c0_seq1:85-486(+)
MYSSASVFLLLGVCVNALVFNFNKGVEQEISPTMIAIVVAVVISILLAIFLIAKSRGEGYRAFGDKSGLSTSSSDITSSETGSTDRELKSRMERFEKRLEEHKSMLEKRKDDSSVTESESNDGSTAGGPWMKM